MDKHDVGESSDKTANSEKASDSSAKVATESVTSEPQAQKYEHRFTSFSSNRSDVTLDADSPLQQLISRVLRTGPEATQGFSEFTIEDRDLGKLITARGERSSVDPKQSFISGLKRLSEAHELSPEQRERMQAQFSIDYITRKANEFFRDTANGIKDGLQGLIAHGQPDGATQSAQPVEAGPATGQAMVQAGSRFYPADSVIADSGQIATDASPAPTPRAWEKVANPPVAWDIALRKNLGDKAAMEYMAAWEVSGKVQEVNSIPSAMLDTYSSLLNDPKRNSGEFNFAFGEKDGKIYMSRVWFNPGIASDGSEIQEPLGAKELTDMGLQILSADHSHPLHKDKAYWTFSPDDMRLGQKFDGDLHRIRFFNQDKHFMQCLLTPAPDNKLMLYEANYNIPDDSYNKAAPRIKELGHFSKEGTFVPNLKERELLKKLGFTE